MKAKTAIELINAAREIVGCPKVNRHSSFLLQQFNHRLYHNARRMVLRATKPDFAITTDETDSILALGDGRFIADVEDETLFTDEFKKDLVNAMAEELLKFKS